VRFVRRAVLLVLLAACGGDDQQPAVGDGGIDAPSSSDDANGSCQGQCKLTNLTATFNATRTLDSAYYGTMFDSPALRIEAYRTGTPGCPTMNSPTPDYTVVLGEVAPDQPTSNMSTANILDFKGDLLGGPLGLAATAKQIDRTAWSPGNFIAVDVMLTFATGTVVGHIYATHCASLDM
jgi:hypothetical protein